MRTHLLLIPILVLSIIFSTNAQSEWKTLKTGAGGWVTGIDIHPTGNPKYVRVDVGSAYRWNESDQSWTNIVTSNNIPEDDIYWNKYNGVLSIVAAPSNRNIAYMAYHDGIYRSTNQGDTWTKTNLPSIEMHPNDDESKLSGERLSVDPNNEDVVYFGSIDDGLYYTTNGGQSWTKINVIPNGDIGRGIRQILFDTNAGTSNDKTNKIYVFVDGEGVYQSDNAGVTWSLLSFGVNNPWFYDAEIDKDGNIYITGESSSYVAYGVYRYDGNNWKQVFTEDLSIAMSEIAIDPFNPDRVFVFSNGFTDTYRTTNVDAATPDWDYLTDDRTATDIDWLPWSYGDWFSLGEIVFDPVVPNRIWKADGVGVWQSDDINDTNLTWVEKSKGQEHLVSNDLVALPNNKVVTAHWDRPLFLHEDLDEYPVIHQPSSRFNSAWSIDVSPTDPNFLVSIVDDHRFCCYDDETQNSGYSEDGGVSWTQFATMPEDVEMFGQIAVSANDNDNIIWLGSGNRMPYFTKDKGQSWTPVTLPGHSESCCMGAFYFKRLALTADQVDPNTFYIYDWGAGHIFKTIDGGSSWNRFANVLPAWSYNAKLVSVPNKAGHLFFANGPEESLDLIEGLYHSTDGGENWILIPDTDEILNVAVGKAAGENAYPTIFIHGRVDGIFGFFMSNDQGTSWTNIGTYPLGIYDLSTVMKGDPHIYGRLYIGFGGNGFVYHDLNIALPVTYQESFWGYHKDAKNHLFWITEEELNNDYFEVERSINSQDWDTIKRVTAQASKSYKVIDIKPYKGVNYYRLKQVDLDGQFNYSNVITIDNNSAINVQVYPNPVNDQITIEGALSKKRLSILDVNGKVVKQLLLRSNETKLTMTDIATGVYLLRIQDSSGNYIYTERIVKK